MLPHLEGCVIFWWRLKRGGKGAGKEMKKVELFRPIECAQAVKGSELRCQHGGPVDCNF